MKRDVGDAYPRACPALPSAIRLCRTGPAQAGPSANKRIVGTRYGWCASQGPVVAWEQTPFGDATAFPSQLLMWRATNLGIAQQTARV